MSASILLVPGFGDVQERKNARHWAPKVQRNFDMYDRTARKDVTHSARCTYETDFRTQTDVSVYGAQHTEPPLVIITAGATNLADQTV